MKENVILSYIPGGILALWDGFVMFLFSMLTGIEKTESGWYTVPQPYRGTQ